MSFLADVLTIFSRYQQLLQGDSVTVIDVERLTANVKTNLLSLRNQTLTGGWLETYQNSVVTIQDDANGENSEEKATVMLKGIILRRKSTSRRKEHHRYVSENRDVDAVFNEVVTSLVEFLDQRFAIDADLISVAKSFVGLKSSSNLKNVHTVLCPDLDLAELSLEYSDLLQLDTIETLRKMSLTRLVVFLAQSDAFKTVATVMARLLAAKPHSADVERLISSSNALKSIDRSSLDVDTENEYLYIYHNMPPLIEWNPRESVLLWLRKREHRVKETPKATAQKWFRGIFPSSGEKQQGVEDFEDSVEATDAIRGSSKTVRTF